MHTRNAMVMAFVLAFGTGTPFAPWAAVGRAEAQAATTVHNAGLFTIALPDTWETKPAKGDTALQAVGPADGSALPDTVEVVIRPLPSNVTDAKSCEGMAKWVTRVFLHVNYTTLAEGPLSIGTLPAYAHTYTWKAPTGEQRWTTQACVVAEGRAFVLSGTTADVPHGAPARAGLVMGILNSFRLTGTQR
jgi:hypothetical protein